MGRNTVIGKKQRSAVGGRRSVKRQRPGIEDQSKIGNRKSETDKGFTLLELMITMFILIILLSVALPAYQSSVQQARENVLRQNLWQVRRQIDQYATDKGKLPQSLDDLVKANYLRELPVDPITEKSEWNEIQGEDTTSTEGEQGLKDVKSLAEGEDGEGKRYEDY
ncbi:MAG TPA: type II secretion system protein [Pyrinomonadaceae bacterium]|nr:type II secretion system protein [Pyrinomonadaceae bacterium]